MTVLGLVIILFYIFSNSAGRENVPVNYTYLVDTFDWQAFIEIYPECLKKGVVDAITARNYYVKHHHAQNPYYYPHLYPKSLTFEAAKSKMQRYIRLLNDQAVPRNNRTLIIYHIGWMITENSFDVTINNLKLFISAMIDDSLALVPKAFYWINMLGGKENLLYKYFPPAFFVAQSTNIALLDWIVSPSDMYTHFRTLEILRDEQIFARPFEDNTFNQFSSVIFLNNEARGPLNYFRRGEWISRFHSLLFHQQNGLVGPILSCEVKPHIQTHAFAIRATFIPSILQEYRNSQKVNNLKHWRYIVKHYEIGLSQLAISANYTLASFLYEAKRNQEKVFNGKCLKKESNSGFMTDRNPMRWCQLPMREILFMKWGGSPFRKTGFICPKMKTEMDEYLGNLSKAIINYFMTSSSAAPSPLMDTNKYQILPQNGKIEILMKETNQRFPMNLDLTTPEILRGGFLYDLYKQYNQELLAKPTNVSVITDSPASSSSLCLLTNFYGHQPFHLPSRAESAQAKAKVVNWNDQFIFETLKSEFDAFFQALQRQSHPNWKLYLLAAAVKPKRSTTLLNNANEEQWKENIFDYDEILSRLLSYIESLQHPQIRFIYFPIEEKFDSMLEVYDRLWLNASAEIFTSCQWMMVTSIFHKFGSQVIARIHSQINKSLMDSSSSTPTMIMIPMDSKRFVYQDLSNRILPHWSYRCLHYLSYLSNHPLGFFFQPLPIPERIDLSSVVFPVSALLQEQLYFGNFTMLGYRKYLKSSSFLSTDPAVKRNQKVSPYGHTRFDPVYQDFVIAGQYLQYLVRYRQWQYLRLPLDGLASMVVETDAPTYCLAAGNVWFDHPIVSFSNCYTPEQVDRMHLLDVKGRNSRNKGKRGKDKTPYVFDWKEFDRNNRMCLRFGREAYYGVFAGYPTLKRHLPSKMKSSYNVTDSTSSSSDSTSYESASTFSTAAEELLDMSDGGGGAGEDEETAK